MFNFEFLIGVLSKCPHGSTKLPSQPAFGIDCQAAEIPQMEGRQ
jgi:hypothetical protein